MQKFLNNYEATLTNAIDDTQASFYVSASTKFDEIQPLGFGEYYLLTIDDGTNLEIVKVTAVTIGPPNQLIVERDASAGAHGSYAFEAGTTIRMSITAESLNEIVDSISNPATGAYPPAFTVSPTHWTSGATITVPFTPLVIQEIFLDAPASGVTVNLTATTNYGTSYIIIRRMQEDDPWPGFAFNGDTGVFVGGYRPGIGVVGIISVTRLPGSSSSAVTFDWITDRNNPFFSSVIDQGSVPNGTTVTFFPIKEWEAAVHKIQFGTGCSIDFSIPGTPFVFREMFICVQGGTGVPTIKMNTVTQTVKGTAPAVGVNGILKATFMTNAFAKFEWL